jgi:hypothetical protein
MKKFSKQNHRLLAIWAIDCAKHVLPYFEKEYPKDGRPKKAIEACRAWVRTGIFKMANIRRASLAAHAAARKAKEKNKILACFAARAAGQAVATAHVAQHSFGTSYYALKIAAANPSNSKIKITKELDWQSRHFPKNLKKEWQNWKSKQLPKSLRQK